VAPGLQADLFVPVDDHLGGFASPGTFPSGPTPGTPGM
jgi:hypothetical protein